MRRLLLLSTLLLLASALAAVLLAEVTDLAAAGPGVNALASLESGIVARTPASLRDNNSLHYIAHLVAGRVLSVCPCTRKDAEVQYAKAALHARSRRQLDLVTTGRPRPAGALVIDALQGALSALRWLGARL